MDQMLAVLEGLQTRLRSMTAECRSYRETNFTLQPRNSVWKQTLHRLTYIVIVFRIEILLYFTIVENSKIVFKNRIHESNNSRY